LKILGYQDIEDNHTVYIDASIEIKASVYTFAYQWEEDFTLLQHRGRDCIYREADAVISMGKDKIDIVYNQIGAYAKDRFPEHAGLIQTGLLMRRRNKKVDKLCNAWWKEVEKHSKRDQLSFNYVAWKQRNEYNLYKDLNIRTVPRTIFSGCFILHGHRIQYFDNAV